MNSQARVASVALVFVWPGGPQSKVPAEATTVTPDGFCVVSDLLWREPELLDFAAAVQLGLIVVVR
jgi:hypothetical protein